MKIGIDTFGCEHGRSGPGSYVLSLMRNMPENEHTINLFGPEIDRYTYNSGLSGVSYSGVNLSDSLLSERLWHIVKFPSFSRRQGYQALLFPAGSRLLPLSFEIPSIVMIQDIVTDMFRDSDDGIFTSLLKSRLRKVNHIIAASEFIRSDLIKLNIDPAKITVIYNGIDTNLFYPRENLTGEAVLIHPFSIRRPYIIYASRVAYPSKCHIELIHGFNLFKQQTGAPHRLVLAGADGVNAEVVHREVLKSPYASDILLTGYFPHQNLPELYSAADACVFPSAAEGVGLPVLEAMACGIPVACARSGALPEIAGDGVLYFDQTNAEEIASCIARIIRQPTGSTDSLRTELVGKALAHIKKYSWDDCAKATLSCIESTVQ